MKYLLLIILSLFSYQSIAQDTISVDNKTYYLFTYDELVDINSTYQIKDKLDQVIINLNKKNNIYINIINNYEDQVILYDIKLNNKDSIISELELKLNILKNINKKHEDITKIDTENITNLKQDIEIFENEIKRQKIKTKLIFIGSIILLVIVII